MWIIGKRVKYIYGFSQKRTKKKGRDVNKVFKFLAASHLVDATSC